MVLQADKIEVLGKALGFGLPRDPGAFVQEGEGVGPDFLPTQTR